MVTDPIANLINQLKNAQLAGRSLVVVPFSNFKLAIAELLKQEGYVKAFTKKGKKAKKFLEVELNTESGSRRIQGVKRMSKPSCRVYRRAAEVRSVRRGYGVGVYSTPQGVLSDKMAKTAKVGGELLFNIW